MMFSWDLDFDSHDASITLDVENETVDAVNHTMERRIFFRILGKNSRSGKGAFENKKSWD